MRRLATGILLSVLWAPTVVAATFEPVDWESLRGRPIVQVDVLSTEIFDPRAPGEDLRIMGWANALHVVTREGVIRRELLFAEGDPIDPLLIQESARNLRNLGIFQDVHIEPEEGSEGVTLVVHTSDRWATKLITDLSSEGGITRLRLGLENINFLGRAKSLGGTVEASTDVDALNLFLFDPRVLGSRWRLSAEYLETSLVRAERFAVGHPLYSETAHWTAAYSYNGARGERRIFYSGEDTDSLDVDERTHEGFVGRQFPGHVLQRLALVASEQRLEGDVGQRRATLAVSYSLMQRRYRTLRYVDVFGVHEDAAAGWNLQLLLGMDLEGLGADANRPAWRVDASRRWFVGGGGFLGVQVRHHGFDHGGRLENSRTLMETWGFWQAGAQTLAWSLGGAVFEGEPVYERMAFGGDARLRGYDARRQVGTRSLWLNVEERLFSDVRLFFLHLGAAAFIDVAQAWDSPAHPTWRAFDVGAGGGLRIGNNKSGNGVVRLDVAYGRQDWRFSLASGSFVRVARGMLFPDPSLLR